MRELNEWNINPDAETLEFHKRQWEKPYRSTMEFARFIQPLCAGGQSVLDLGCGGGAPTFYLAEEYPDSLWVGVDSSEYLVRVAEAKEASNCEFVVGDMFALPELPVNIGGVVSLATMSWLPQYEPAIEQICTKIKPRWMAFSSLLYDGDISCNIVVSEPKRPRVSFYNVYSVPRMTEFLGKYGYRLDRYQPFNIDIGLPEPFDKDIMKTYTQHGRQFSGPLWLPWGFISFVKHD